MRDRSTVSLKMRRGTIGDFRWEASPYRVLEKAKLPIGSCMCHVERHRPLRDGMMKNISVLGLKNRNGSQITYMKHGSCPIRRLCVGHNTS